MKNYFYQILIKDILDKIFAALLILIFLPFILLIYLIIAREGRNVIYKQTRVGKNGKLFKCLKFRTMVVNSEEILSNLLKSNENIRAEWERDFKLKNDPRVTEIGKFLRKTSLDELPQLFNVLFGSMSLVGPRPIIINELEKYGNKADYYLGVKPGMTGLWQISGRSDTNYAERVELDVLYINNISFYQDVVILLRTIKVVIKGRGAY